MTKSPFNNPRTIVCIHCQYERDVGDGIEICPECGNRGLVYKNHLAPRLRLLRRWVWGEIVVSIALVTFGIAVFVPGSPRFMSEYFLLALIAATIQGFVGVLITGSSFDRRALWVNRSLKRFAWFGMILSCLLLCSIGITTFISVITGNL